MVGNEISPCYMCQQTADNDCLTNLRAPFFCNSLVTRLQQLFSSLAFTTFFILSFLYMIADIARAFQDCHDDVTRDCEPKKGIKHFTALSQLRNHCRAILASSAELLSRWQKWACDSSAAFFFDFDKSIYHVVNLILDMNDSKGADKTGYILR